MFQKTAISKIGTWSWNSSPNEFQAGSSPFASSMKREIICLEMEFRTSGCEIQRQQYSIIESTIFKCRKPVIWDMTSWWRHRLSKNIYAALNRPEFNAFWIARNQNLFSNLSTLKSPPCLESFELNLNFTFPHNRSNPSKRHKLLYDSAGISQIYTWVPLNNPRHNRSCVP